MASALSLILMQLYRLARGVPSPQFREAVLEELQHRLPFDSAIWCTFVTHAGGAGVRSSLLYRLPRQMMRDYEQIKQHDWLRSSIIATPGVTLNVSAEHVARTVSEEARHHMRSYGMEYVLSTAWAERALHLWTAISLYRGPSGEPFTEQERELKQTG